MCVKMFGVLQLMYNRVLYVNHAENPLIEDLGPPVIETGSNKFGPSFHFMYSGPVLI